VRSVLTPRCESQVLKSEGMIGMGHPGAGVVGEPPEGDGPLNALPSQEQASESALQGKPPRGRRSDRAPVSVFPPRAALPQASERPPKPSEGVVRAGAVDPLVCGVTTAPMGVADEVMVRPDRQGSDGSVTATAETRPMSVRRQTPPQSSRRRRKASRRRSHDEPHIREVHGPADGMDSPATTAVTISGMPSAPRRISLLGGLSTNSSQAMFVARPFGGLRVAKEAGPPLSDNPSPHSGWRSCYRRGDYAADCIVVAVRDETFAHEFERGGIETGHGWREAIPPRSSPHASRATRACLTGQLDSQNLSERVRQGAGTP
jgi:hypothetical protein